MKTDLALHKITLLKLLAGQLIVPLAGHDLLLDHLLQLQVTVITSQLKIKNQKSKINSTKHS